jgi:hypothetical protein
MLRRNNVCSVLRSLCSLSCLSCLYASPTPVLLLLGLLAPSLGAQEAESFPIAGIRAEETLIAHTGARIVPGRAQLTWQRPPFRYEAQVATGRKLARVAVVIYDPVLRTQGGKSLRAWLGAHEGLEFSHILVDVIRQASWGYVNYEIAEVIRVDGWPKKVDGFRYDEASYLEARAKKEWQPATISYRAMLEETGLLARVARPGSAEGLHEVWLWGADGMHFDEFAGVVKERDQRFGPTDNPWLYRPYDLPAELGRTFWVMGFNMEVGADNMIHSYTHRVESMAALAFADGIWDPKSRRDAWNVFSRLEMDFPGTPSMVGNCHVPPNGQSGYDYANARRVPSWAHGWDRYPDLRCEPREISAEAWGRTQFGYQKWILERLPKGAGATDGCYDNWWVYVANTDGDLPEWTPPQPGALRLPTDLR